MPDTQTDMQTTGRKRKLEDFIKIDEKSDRFVEASIAEKELSNEYLEDETFVKLTNSNHNPNCYIVTSINQTLEANAFRVDPNFLKVKKIKRTVMNEACKEVCEELEVQTKKWLSCEEVMQEVKTLKEKVKELEPLKEKVGSSEKKVKTLEQESNESMAKHILQTIVSNRIRLNFIADSHKAFKFNVKLLAEGRKNLNPSDFHMFKEFRKEFPYDVNFSNYFGEEKIQPVQEINDTDYVKWLCSLFKSLEDENQTSQN